MFQTFVYKGLYPELEDGFFLCDPNRLDIFLRGEAKGTDLLTRFRITNEGIEACKQGIAIPVFGVEPNNYTIVVRDVAAQSCLFNSPYLVSTGWILDTDSGNLVVCALSNLMYWEPDDDERINEGLHNAYVHFKITPGLYKIEIHGGINHEASENEEWILEFVLSPISDDAKPVFSADLTKAHIFHQYKDIYPNTKVEFSTQEVRKLSQENRVDTDLVPTLLSRLNKTAFASFVVELFDEEEEPFIELTELGKGIFRKPWLDSYGESLETAFVLQYLPVEILNQPELVDVTSDPYLIEQLKKVKDYYQGRVGAYGMVSGHLVIATKLRSLGFLTNLSGIERKRYYDKLIPRYGELAQATGLYTSVLVGSYDSFIDLSTEKSAQAFKRFLTKYSDGLTISLSESDVEVSSFISERNLSGVLNHSKHICEPVFITELYGKKKLISDFEALLHMDTREDELEDFLQAYYQEIFGYDYDRIETQIWLKFPDLDIAQKNRRLDIFLRNSVSNDWELFEIKRVIPLTGMYRDIPTIAKEISYAVQQVKNYARVLAQDSVKRQLAQQGIEYYEPSLNLVVGRTPNIPLAQWRWLIATHDRDVRLLTYDNLLKQMQNRFDAYNKFL